MDETAQSGDDGTVTSSAMGPAEQTHDEALARSDMARFLQPSAFPARKSAIVASAREDDAPGQVLAQLERLPADVEFSNVAAVWEALGHRTEHRPAN